MALGVGDGVLWAAFLPDRGTLLSQNTLHELFVTFSAPHNVERLEADSCATIPYISVFPCLLSYVISFNGLLLDVFQNC